MIPKLAPIKSKILKSATFKSRYDLPLHQSAGTSFLMLLVGLMTFLALMAITATFILGGVAQHWSAGLENKMTVEIPALKSDETLRNKSEINDLEEEIKASLQDNPNIELLEILQEDEITKLISPWLGDDVALDEIPLPGLISVHLHIRDDVKLRQIQNTLKNIAPDIRLDTHENWLGDILRLAGTLQISSLLVTLIILATTVTAIAGAVRSRMAEHRADIELLHLMGASDLYITKQLQRHAIILTLKGCLAGVAFGMFILLGLALLNNQSENSMLPELSLSMIEIFALLMLPAALGAIASQTARMTVLRVLRGMP